MAAWTDVTIVIPTVLGPRASAFTELHGRIARLCLGALVGASLTTGDSRCDAARAWEFGRTQGRPWVLAIEDDAWPADAFGKDVPVLLADAPAPCVVLFSRRAAHVPRGWHRARAVPSTVAVACRAEIIASLEDWAPSWYAAHPEHAHASDLLLSAWLARQGAGVAVWSPSLVQHRAGRSTFRGRARMRQSATYRASYGEVPPLPEPDRA